MSEEPKSIWKKSFTGRTALVIWLAIVAFALMAGCFIIALANYDGPMSYLFMGVGIIMGVILAAFLIFIYIVWPLLRLLFWTHWRRTLFGLACFATLVALFYAEEDWRGRHAWGNYVREREAAGEKMDWKSYVPPQIPDDQNLAMCPLLKPSLDYTRTNNAGIHVIWNDTNGITRLYRIDPRWNEWNNTNEPHRQAGSELDENGFTNGWVNLPAWQNYFRTGTNLDGVPAGKSPAQDVLLALRFMEPDLAELQDEAARRPLARWPLHYETDFLMEILLPHLADVRRIVRTLQLRSAARLAGGDVAGGLADIELGLRLANSPESEPFQISLLVRETAFEDILQPLREGIARHEFSDPQLFSVQQQLSALDFLATFDKSYLAERAMQEQWQKLTSSNLEGLVWEMNFQHLDIFRMRLLVRFAPKGWMYQNQLALCRLRDQLALRVIDVRSHQAFPALAKNPERMADELPWQFSILAKFVFSLKFLDQVPQETAYHQTVIDQAVIACALERYRLAHGEYPETLDSLAPQFIAQVPHDVIGGQPLHYRRTSDGQFVLYSIGWNEKDDGGMTAYRNDGHTPDIESGDWVWRYPQK